MNTTDAISANGQGNPSALSPEAGESQPSKPRPLPQLQGKNCALRQLAPSDYEWLYGLWMQPENLMTFRFGGLPPSPERFAALVWQGVSCQFVITREERPAERLGLVTFYNQAERAQVASLAVVLEERTSRAPWVWEGVVLAVDHFFRVTQVRKLCLEIAEWNLERFRGLEVFGVRHEGCQREQEFMDDQWWDRHLYALFKQDWQRARETVLRVFGSGPAGPAGETSLRAQHGTARTRGEL